MITFGSLFTGIGLIDLGLLWAGMKCMWQVEIDPFGRKVLDRRFPNVPKHEDVRNVGRYNLEPVDLICGGFPCQDVSIIGARKGLDGERSVLWRQFKRVICELRPRWVLAENVVGILSSDDGRFFGEVLRDLAESGYDAEWQVLPASAFGAPHIRERVFIVCHSNSVTSGKASKPPLPIMSEGRTWGNDRAEHWQTASSPNWDKNSSEFLRVADGRSPELDKLRRKALGNAVVPQVAEWIGRRIVEATSREVRE